MIAIRVNNFTWQPHTHSLHTYVHTNARNQTANTDLTSNFTFYTYIYIYMYIYIYIYIFTPGSTRPASAFMLRPQPCWTRPPTTLTTQRQTPRTNLASSPEQDDLDTLIPSIPVSQQSVHIPQPEHRKTQGKFSTKMIMSWHGRLLNGKCVRI